MHEVYLKNIHVHKPGTATLFLNNKGIVLSRDCLLPIQKREQHPQEKFPRSHRQPVDQGGEVLMWYQTKSYGRLIVYIT